MAFCICLWFRSLVGNPRFRRSVRSSVSLRPPTPSHRSDGRPHAIRVAISAHQCPSTLNRAHQSSSELISAHQRAHQRAHQSSSGLIRAHQISSELIRAHQGSSGALISGAHLPTRSPYHQGQSRAINANQGQSRAIKRTFPQDLLIFKANQGQSRAIKGNQAYLPTRSPYLRCAVSAGADEAGSAAAPWVRSGSC